jgi:hypothetical protein
MSFSNLSAFFAAAGGPLALASYYCYAACSLVAALAHYARRGFKPAYSVVAA